MSVKYPNYLIIGTMKGGTDSAVYHLNQHPDIFVYPSEIHWFDYNENYQQPIEQYQRKFSCNVESNSANKKYRGEKTPAYMCSKQTLERIKMFNQDMKLIVILREPIQRSHSHYKHQMKIDQKKGGEIIDFRDFLNNEKPDCKHPITRGKYDLQLNNILDLFPRKKILVLISEEIKLNPQKEYNKVFQFLNLARYNIKFKANVHKSLSIPLKLEDIIYLKYYFNESNENLYKLLDRRIESWEKFYEDLKL